MYDQETVVNYLGAIERAICTAFENEGIAGSLLRGWQGPQALTFRVQPYRPNQQIIRRILGMVRTIEALTQTEPVRVYSYRGVIHIEIPSPFPFVIAGTALPGLPGKRLAAALGVTGMRAADGGLVVEHVDFAQPSTPHLIAVGPTGGGKTTALQAILYHLCRQNPAGRLALIVFADASKARRWGHISVMSHCLALITDPHEAQTALRWIVDELIPARGHNREWFIVLDDLLNLLKAAPVGEQLAAIASIGRESRVHLLIGTQRLGDRGVGDAAVAGNITTRLVFRAANAGDAHQFTGQADSGAERLSAQLGDCLYVRSGDISRLALSMVEARAWRELAAQPGRGISAERRPWLQVTGSVTVTTQESRFTADVRQIVCPPAPEPVSEPVSEPPVPELARVLPFPTQNLSAEEIALLASVELPLPRREPDETDRAIIQALYRATGSRNRTLRAAYGGKNDRYARWVASALEEK